MKAEPNKLPAQVTTGYKRAYAPIEYWLILGLALASSGLRYESICTIIVYFLLKRFRPAAGFSLRFVCSIYLGRALLGFFQFLFLNLGPHRFGLILAPIVLSGVTMLFFATEKRFWAWLFLIDPATEGTIETMCALSPVFTEQVHEGNRSQSLAQALIMWMVLWQIMGWLRKHASEATAPADGALPIEAANLKSRWIDSANEWWPIFCAHSGSS